MKRQTAPFIFMLLTLSLLLLGSCVAAAATPAAQDGDASGAATGRASSASAWRRDGVA